MVFTFVYSLSLVLLTFLLTFVTGFAKTDHNVTLGQLHFIYPAYSHTHILYYPCTVALMGLFDCSAFLKLVLLTM